MKKLLFWLRIFFAGAFGAELAHCGIIWNQPRFWVLIVLFAFYAALSSVDNA
jgi:hypothetical protein